MLPPPDFFELRVTLRCNLRCKQCCWWQEKSPKELPTETWKNIILDIKNTVGPCFVRFYGGEPFYRADLLELIHFCHRNNTIPLITTNGTLINRNTAEELEKNKVRLVNISIDGFKAETHDKLRGIPGTYHKAMKAIEYLQGKVPIQINTTIMDSNLDEILDLTDFAYRNKIPISFQAYNPTRYVIKDPVFVSGDLLLPKDSNKVDYVIDQLCARKKYNSSIIDSSFQLQRIKYYYHQSPKLEKKYCEAIGARLMIKEDGRVTLCGHGGPLGSIGNIAEQSLAEIWKSKIALQKNSKMRTCSETECLVCRGAYKESYFEKIAKFKRWILKS